jgi:hypothetical protein
MEKIKTALADALAKLNAAIAEADQEAAKIYAHILASIHELL